MTPPDPTEIIKSLSRPLEPLGTDVNAELEPQPGIRAVVFDIYGTMLVSGSGDIGVAQADDREGAMRSALSRCGLPLRQGGTRAVDIFHDAVAAAQRLRQREGIEFPEVEIRDVWRDTLRQLSRSGDLEGDLPDAGQVEALAITYECMVNPVWPMPGLAGVLAALAARGIVMGVVSNAQFFTPQLFDALLGRDLDALGFDPAARVYSYRLREAKPSKRLYEQLVSELRTHGIQPHEVLYVGNDMRNDIWPARATGLRTALFAGDSRSLRLRGDDPDVRDLKPNVVLTDLRQLLEVLT